MKNLLYGVLALIAGIFMLGFTNYNGLVNKDEAVNRAAGNLQSDYQRRADLIPNLVSIVKGNANFESSTQIDVVEARAKATQTQVDISNMSAEQLQNLARAQDQLTGSLNKLLVVVEKYPELKANQAFQNLMIQLEGTENRIKYSREQYNGAVEVYNRKVRSSSVVLIAGLMGFEKRPYFQAEAGSQSAPTINFD